MGAVTPIRQNRRSNRLTLLAQNPGSRNLRHGVAPLLSNFLHAIDCFFLRVTYLFEAKGMEEAIGLRSQRR